MSSPRVLCASGSTVGWLTVAGARARRRAGQCLQRGHHRHRPAANSAAGGAPIAAASWKSSRWSSLAGYHVGGLAPDVHRTPLKASFLLAGHVGRNASMFDVCPRVQAHDQIGELRSYRATNRALSRGCTTLSGRLMSREGVNWEFLSLTKSGGAFAMAPVLYGCGCGIT